MKKEMIRTVLTATLIGAAIAASVVAQSRPLVRAKIPFSFTVGNKTMPVGNYQIERSGNSGHLVLLRSEHGGAAFTLATGKQGRVEADKTKLVFRRYGDQYFLSQMWTKGDINGVSFPVTSAEKKLSNSNLARNLAINQEMETVTVDVD